MDSTIVAAIIGGTFTVIASIATYAITYIFDSNLFLAAKNMHHHVLDGNWKGNIHQEGGVQGIPMDMQADITFKSTRRVVRGEGSITGTFKNQNFNAPILLLGRFVEGGYIKIDYDYRLTTGQFGVALLELSPDGRILEGYLTGYGPISRKIIYGRVQLSKQGVFLHLPASP